MTTLLKKAYERLEALPPEDQDAMAERILAEIQERLDDARFSELADEALSESNGDRLSEEEMNARLGV